MFKAKCLQNACNRQSCDHPSDPLALQNACNRHSCDPPSYPLVAQQGVMQARLLRAMCIEDACNRHSCDPPSHPLDSSTMCSIQSCLRPCASRCLHQTLSWPISPSNVCSKQLVQGCVLPTRCVDAKHAWCCLLPSKEQQRMLFVHIAESYVVSGPQSHDPQLRRPQLRLKSGASEANALYVFRALVATHTGVSCPPLLWAACPSQPTQASSL